MGMGNGNGKKIYNRNENIKRSKPNKEMAWLVPANCNYSLITMAQNANFVEQIFFLFHYDEENIYAEFNAKQWRIISLLRNRLIILIRFLLYPR